MLNQGIRKLFGCPFFSILILSWQDLNNCLFSGTFPPKCWGISQKRAAYVLPGEGPCCSKMLGLPPHLSTRGWRFRKWDVSRGDWKVGKAVVYVGIETGEGEGKQSHRRRGPEGQWAGTELEVTGDNRSSASSLRQSLKCLLAENSMWQVGEWLTPIKSSPFATEGVWYGQSVKSLAISLTIVSQQSEAGPSWRVQTVPINLI